MRIQRSFLLTCWSSSRQVRIPEANATVAPENPPLLKIGLLYEVRETLKSAVA